MTLKFFFAFVYDIVNSCMIAQFLILFLAFYMTSYVIMTIWKKYDDVDFFGDILPSETRLGLGTVHMFFLFLTVPYLIISLVEFGCREETWNQLLRSSPAMWFLNTFYRGGSFGVLIAFFTPIAISGCLMAAYLKKIEQLLYKNQSNTIIYGVIITYAIALLTASYFFSFSAENAYKDFKQKSTNTAYISRVLFVKAIDKNTVY